MKDRACCRPPIGPAFVRMNPSTNHAGGSAGQTVAVLGASDNPDRYAFQAIELLRQHGHTVFPVTPKPLNLPGLTVYSSIADVPRPLDTVTVYINPRILADLLPDLLTARPRRVIFNPGTESADAETALREAGIATEAACTLVLLRTGGF